MTLAMSNTSSRRRLRLHRIGLSAPILQKGVAGGKGDGGDNAPIPMPLLSHKMRENGA